LLLRSPLHGLVSGRIMLLTVTGRRSGRSFTVPVSYLRYGENILSFTSGEWSARAESGGDAVVRALGAFLAEFPATAGRYGVGLGADGRPCPHDMEAAVEEGRAIMVIIQAPG
jgi:hypothetical protein